MTNTEYTITKAQWAKLPREYRTGDPRKGTAKMLKMTEHGTSLVPVKVVA
jgi:hypothetical protein